VVVAGLLLLAGGIVLFAASPSVSITADKGTLTAGANLVSSSSASDGKDYVKLGVATTYTVVGNTIENSSGQPVLVHGVNRPSLESSCTGTSLTGQPTGIPASDFATMHNAWGATAVRLPLDQDFWLSGANRYCSGYQATVQAAVQEIEANHMVAILDLHWSDDGSLADPALEQQCMPSQNSITFWQQVAAQYKSDPNVWFELYNEPHPPGSTMAQQWSTWQNGGSVTCAAAYKNAPMVTFQAPGMQQLVNTVRATGANNIVLVDGLHIPNVGPTLVGVPFLSGGNIGYSVHPYDNDQPLSTQQAEWTTNFGPISAQVPVVATEFGDLNCGSPGYDNAILSFFRAHSISYTAWAWDVGGCSYPSLISDAAGDCQNSYGCALQQDIKSYVSTPSPGAGGSCANTPDPTQGTDTQTINVSTTGTYYLWSRLLTPNATNNSYYLQVDGGCAIDVGGGSSIPANTWTWVNYQDGNPSSVTSLNLTAGTHKVVLTGNKPGVGVDKVMLLADAKCVPTGIGSNCASSGADTTPPTVPGGLMAKAVSSTQVTLSWQASTDNVGVTSYRIYRNGSSTAYATVAAPLTSFTDAAVSANTAYSYTVAALDAAGNQSTQSSPVSVTTPANPITTPPTAPNNFHSISKDKTTTAITLAWNASSDKGGPGVAGYRLYRNGVLIASPQNLQYADSNLKASTTYTYTLRAYDHAGNLSASSRTLAVHTRYPAWQIWHLGG
jgi:endoglucanase